MSTARKCLPALFVALCLLAAPAFSAEKVAKIDVNTATAKEMADALPGIGKVKAEKIVKGRPYKNDEDLIKAGLTEKDVEKIKGMITFGTHKADAKESSKTASGEKPTVAKTDKEEVVAKVPPQKGMVWVNTESKIYHKEGDRWYGKTKNGEFMTEDAALKMGARASKEGGGDKKPAEK